MTNRSKGHDPTPFLNAFSLLNSVDDESQGKRETRRQSWPDRENVIEMILNRFLMVQSVPQA